MKQSCDQYKVTEPLGIELRYFGISALVAMGYTNTKPNAPKRKSPDDLLTVVA